MTLLVIAFWRLSMVRSAGTLYPYPCSYSCYPSTRHLLVALLFFFQNAAESILPRSLGPSFSSLTLAHCLPHPEPSVHRQPSVSFVVRHSCYDLGMKKDWLFVLVLLVTSSAFANTRHHRRHHRHHHHRPHA